MPVTLAAVSQRSGYSLATVCRVVNGGDGVRKEVQERVEAAIRELGFVARRPRVPAVAARTIDVILHRQTPIEQVAVDGAGLSVGPLTAAAAENLLTGPWKLSNDFYRQILDGILAELAVHGHKAVLQVAHDLTAPELLAGAADATLGVLLVGEGGLGLERFIAACPRPLVLVDILHRGGPDQVTTDNLAGIGQAFEHLLGLGHRDIGYVGCEHGLAAQERARAFAIHRQRAGLPAPAGWVLLGDSHIERTTAAVAALLARPERPTALICANDPIAIGALRAAERRGLRVPHDLSVVGFDDIEVAALLTPALTSVRVAMHGIGRAAVRQLLGRRTRPTAEDPGCTVRLPTTLMVRSSTGPRP